MKKSSTLFLQAVTVLIGITTLIFLLWAPHGEGVNAQATTLYQIYFDDPFLAYVYVGSIPFFVALYQVFRVLGHIQQNKTFSPATVKALRTIKYCATALVAFIAGAEGYLFVVQRKVEEDIAGGVMMGLIMIFISSIIAAAAAVFERTLQRAIDIKSENNLTI